MPQFESEYEAKLYNDRRASLEKLTALGEKLGLSRAEATFPNSFPFTHTVAQLRALGDPLSAEALDAAPIEAAIAGRLMAHRQQGKAGFAQLQQEGQRLQIYVRKDDVGPTPEQSETLFELYKLLQVGDIVGVRGTLMRTRTGELTLKVHAIHLPGQQDRPALQLLTKAMLALPDKYHGLEDVELRYRQRYVDLIMNSGSRAEPAAPSPAAPTNLSSRPKSSQSHREDVAERPAAPLAPSTQPGASTPEPAAGTPPNSVILSEARTGIPPEPSSLGGVESAQLKNLEGLSPTSTAEPFSTTSPAANVREVFVKRAAILRAIRRFFDDRNYLEVETPMLHTIAGGAAARPFKTHHNALDIPLSLRIAPELYLKRLVVGGLDRVYEINRNFRNEGVSTQHNPEFTMLEFYQAYANYHDLMDLTQELITTVAKEVNGTTIAHFNGHEIDLSQWQKLSMREAIVKFANKELEIEDAEECFTVDAVFSTNAAFLQFLRQICRFIDNWHDRHPEPTSAALREKSEYLSNLRLSIAGFGVGESLKSRFEMAQSDPGKAIALLFEDLSEPHLIQPTIIYDFPLAVSPLSKVKPDEPDWVERFEFYIGGFEVGNAFSELNDPEDQHRRFEAQLKERDRGDDEAHAMDEDYVRALGYGLPPTAGEGIGIDRLTMILTGSRSIRDVILFPLMRPHAQTDAEPNPPTPE